MDIDTVVPVEVEKGEKTLDVDDARLLAMGKKPELQRVYNTWTCECCPHLNLLQEERQAELSTQCVHIRS
jgi:hypothetical protein